MQQYFTDTPLAEGVTCTLTAAQAHHAGNVVHLQGKTIRLVHDGEAYFARCEGTGKHMEAVVLGKDPVSRELPCEIVLMQALIRREKFEWVLQKATELGVSRIIPFESSRCVVHGKKEKEERPLERWRQIVTEAAEQSERNRIPVVERPVEFRKLVEYMQESNYFAYERAYGESPLLSMVYTGGNAAVVIGPEGGFSPEEIAFFTGSGFVQFTLGARILRAETAAAAALAVAAECAERGRR